MHFSSLFILVFLGFSSCYPSQEKEAVKEESSQSGDGQGEVTPLTDGGRSENSDERKAPPEEEYTITVSSVFSIFPGSVKFVNVESGVLKSRVRPGECVIVKSSQFSFLRVHLFWQGADDRIYKNIVCDNSDKEKGVCMKSNATIIREENFSPTSYDWEFELVKGIKNETCRKRLNRV